MKCLTDKLRTEVLQNIMPCRLINGFRRFAGACRLHLQGSLRRLCCVQEMVYYMRKEWQSPPKWRLTIYQLIWRNTSHDMNLHQERCVNHKSRCILSRFLKLSFGQVYSSNILLVIEYTSCDGVLQWRNSHMGRNIKRFHSNSHCGLLELRLADNKMGEGISNSPTGLSVWAATETVS